MPKYLIYKGITNYKSYSDIGDIIFSNLLE